MERLFEWLGYVLCGIFAIFAVGLLYRIGVLLYRRGDLGAAFLAIALIALLAAVAYTDKGAPR